MLLFDNPIADLVTDKEWLTKIARSRRTFALGNFISIKQLSTFIINITNQTNSKEEKNINSF